jgi:hypothetical protein
VPTTSVPVVDEVVETVNTVVADPVGTVDTVVADPVGTVGGTLDNILTTPLLPKPLLPKLGGK